MNAETQHTPSIQDIVREETQNGMLIVRFLISVIEGEIPDTKLWHRLDATRQLRKLGFDYAAALQLAPVRADRVLSPSKEPVEAPHEAVRAEPVEAPTPDTNGTGPSIRHSGIPATAGTGEEAGIQRGGDAPTTAEAPPASVRAEPVEAPDPNTNGASLRPIPQSAGAAVPPLPQGEGWGEGDATGAPPIDTSGLDPDLAQFIRTETDGGCQIMRFFVDVMLGFLPMFKPHLRMDAAKELMRHGFDSPAPTAPVRADRVLSPSKEPASVRAEPVEAPTPDANGASFHPLPQGEGQGEGDALDYEPPYVNTYGHSEDDGFNTRAVFKAADALMDAVGRLPETPADLEAARRSRKHSIIVHNGNEHYFSQCSRGAVESAIATREVMDAIKRIRESCRCPSAFESVDDDHKSVRADPVLSPSKGPVEAHDPDANAAEAPAPERHFP